jgi:hypothetical protein
VDVLVFLKRPASLWDNHKEKRTSSQTPPEMEKKRNTKIFLYKHRF